MSLGIFTSDKAVGADLYRILVLDHGRVVEFGTPWELIQKDGTFRDLCRQSGEDAQLIEVSTYSSRLQRRYRCRQADGSADGKIGT